jgi:hypothetical protein
MALAAGRARQSHNAIPVAGDADRDQPGDAVEGAQRGRGTAVAAAAVRCKSNVPASSIASVCSVSAQQSRLVGAVLAEQHDEWAEPRRHLDVDVLGKSRSDQHPPSEQEAHPAALTAKITPKNHATTSYTSPLDKTADMTESGLRSRLCATAGKGTDEWEVRRRIKRKRCCVSERPTR